MRLLFLISFILLLAGCSESGGSDSESEKPGGYTVFDPNSGEIPYPNDILFAPNDSATDDPGDGTLNIPYEPTDQDAQIIMALNTLVGFSTVAPIGVGVSGTFDPATLEGNMRLFKVNATESNATDPIPMVTGVERELVFGSDFAAAFRDSRLQLLPLTPLKEAAHYMVILTDGIADTEGRSLAPDPLTALLNGETPLPDVYGEQLEELRQLTQRMIAQAVERGIRREEIVMAWSFTTQSIGNVAQAFSEHNATASLQLVSSGMTSKQLLEDAGHDVTDMKGNAAIYTGTPYYLGVPENNASDAPLTSWFEIQEGTDLPKVQDGNRTLPVLASVPNDLGDAPAEGWPVVIFSHGIMQERTNLLAVAEAFAPVPDGAIDPSGAHFVNLLSPLTSRDNIRQHTSDLIALKNALSSATEVAFNPEKVAFVGHSLGAITPFGFLNHRSLESVMLAMPGGGIAELLNNSPLYGPAITTRLGLEGINKGTPEFEAYMVAMQTVLDDGDPINYALGVGGKQRIYAIEVVGDGTEGTDDQVIPNAVSAAPLSGTDPLATHLGASDLNTTAEGTVTLSGNTVARFVEGEHSSFLDPTTSPSATIEMQTQTATFVESGGTATYITDTTLLKQ